MYSSLIIEHFLCLCAYASLSIFLHCLCADRQLLNTFAAGVHDDHYWDLLLLVCKRRLIEGTVCLCAVANLLILLIA